MHTNKNIKFGETTIPAGTNVIPADNLPADNNAGIAYWAEPWEGMSEDEKSRMRLEGYGIGAGDVDRGEEKTYKFTSDMIVTAVNEDEAWKYFSDNSTDFAGNAGIEEVCPNHYEPLLDIYDFTKCKRCSP